jgi:hypothetical protein
MIDARNKKVANAIEQEYAHQYVENTDYQYNNEDDRISYHAEDPDDVKTRDELYSVQPEQTVDSSVSDNKIKVPTTKEQVREDHRQRSYRVRTKPQIYDKTEPGSESYQLMNNPREDEVSKIKETSQSFNTQIQEEQSRDLTTPEGRFPLQPPADNNEDVEMIIFVVGNKVAHKEEGIKGTVKFANDKRLAVVWEDNTRERFTLAEASEFLEYVDTTEQEVSPLQTGQFPKDEEKEEELDGLMKDIVSSLEDSEEEVTEDKIDLEKVKLQRQVNELEAKVKRHDVTKIKEKAAMELIDVMQKKSMLSKEESAVQTQLSAIMSMDDNGFEAFKNAILATPIGSKQAEVDEIEAMLNQDDDFDDIEDGEEFAKAQEVVKKAAANSRNIGGIEMGDTSFFENGGLKNFKGTIGDFSGAGGSTAASASSSNNETRSLSGRKGVQRTAGADKGLNLSGFQDLQGLTKPINIPSKELNPKTKFDDLFSDIQWTTLSKIH